MNLLPSNGRPYRFFIAAGIKHTVLAAILVPLPAVSPQQAHTLHINARAFAFDLSPIAIRRGDLVTIELEVLDAVHGLYLEDYDVNLVVEPGNSARTTFVADKEGKFKFRRSVACGALHPFLIGELNV